MKFLARLGKVFDQINLATVIIASVLVVGLTVIVGADITLRYLFNKPIAWVKEVSEYILVALGFLTAAWLLKDDAHVTMDLVLAKMSPRTQTMLNIITSIISTIIVLSVTWFSFTITVDFYQTKSVAPTVLEPPKWILMTPVIVGSFLLAIQFVRRTYAYMHKWKTLSGQKNDH
jgi:TRAP-type C4-dicarboxylate transport system permease small subunit